jgi:excisionase family DNA binding protein
MILSPSEHAKPKLGVSKMKKTATERLIGADDHSYPVPFKSPEEKDERLLTTPEAASYLRVSKSFLDKLRVYGGGPEFIRPGKRKILYRNSDLDLWADQRRFRSTSEYRDNGIYSRDKSEWMSNAKQQRPIIKLRKNSS